METKRTNTKLEKLAQPVNTLHGADRLIWTAYCVLMGLVLAAAAGAFVWFIAGQ